jgi:hypothetical protein
MGTILEIVDAVGRLTPSERAELFARLHESGFGPSQEEQSSEFSRYESDEFTQELTDCFHQAKRRSLEVDQPE